MDKEILRQSTNDYKNLKKMYRWINKVAVVTGASSIIGLALVKDLITAKVIVAALSRHTEKIEAIRSELPSELENFLHPFKCDTTNENDVIKTFELITLSLGPIHILINYANTLTTGNLLEMDTKFVRKTLDTNVMGTIYCTKAAFKNMKDLKINGHIFLFNSIAGHKVIEPIENGPSINIYPPSKFAITAIADIYRQEIQNLNCKIKVTSISPGLANTEIVPPEWRTLENTGILRAEDIADGIMYALGTPSHVQVTELTILPI